MAKYKVSMNVINRQNINRQGKNVAAKKQLKFKYISNWNNNNNNNKKKKKKKNNNNNNSDNNNNHGSNNGGVYNGHNDSNTNNY
jgi:hypothetical protein